jgi:peroxiredoxin
MLVVPLAGVGLVYVYPPVGVGVAAVGAIMVTFSIFALNVPAARAAAVIAILANAAAVFLASGSWALALAVLPPMLMVMPSELVMRRNRNMSDFGPLVGVLAGVVLLGVALPMLTSVWWVLAVVPHLLLGLLFVKLTLGGRSSYMAHFNRLKVQEGKPLPVDVSLPARDGKETFSLAKHAGQFVLLLFIRGDWCPVCHVMMRIVSKESATLEKHGVKVAIISPTEGQLEDEAVEHMGLDPGMLYDENSNLARALDLIQKDQTNGKDVPLPVTVLIDPQGVVRNISKPDDVTAYSNEQKIISILETAA